MISKPCHPEGPFQLQRDRKRIEQLQKVNWDRTLQPAPPISIAPPRMHCITIAQLK